MLEKPSPSGSSRSTFGLVKSRPYSGIPAQQDAARRTRVRIHLLDIIALGINRRVKEIFIRTERAGDGWPAPATGRAQFQIAMLDSMSFASSACACVRSGRCWSTPVMSRPWDRNRPARAAPRASKTRATARMMGSGDFGSSELCPWAGEFRRPVLAAGVAKRIRDCRLPFDHVDPGFDLDRASCRKDIAGPGRRRWRRPRRARYRSRRERRGGGPGHLVELIDLRRIRDSSSASSANGR